VRALNYNLECNSALEEDLEKLFIKTDLLINNCMFNINQELVNLNKSIDNMVLEILEDWR